MRGRFRWDETNRVDLVRIVGCMKDSSYDKDGQTHYTTERVVEEFDIRRKAGVND